MNFKEGIKLDFICMEMKLTNNKKKYLQQNFTEATCTPNYSRFYDEGQQELCPFYM